MLLSHVRVDDGPTESLHASDLCGVWDVLWRGQRWLRREDRLRLLRPLWVALLSGQRGLRVYVHSARHGNRRLYRHLATDLLAAT
jgi:hypothetical protein